MALLNIAEVNTQVDKFINTIASRDSYLVSTPTGEVLDEVTFKALVKRNQLNVVDERCNKTRRRKATWTYNRSTGKPMLNRLYQCKTAKDSFTRKV